jgi:asparagine synthase (glutamine-hydrolysing)
LAGIFGITNPPIDVSVRAYLENARARMSHRPWYVAQLWQAENAPVGLGQLGIGLLNTREQPVVSQDARYRLLMCGEIYNRAALRAAVTEAGHPPADESDESLALSAFLTYRNEFPARMDGVFFITIFDSLSQQLVLANDRFGQYPHYLYRAGRTLVFAPEVKGVVAAPFVPRRLNLTAVAEYMRFQQLLNEKTFHEDIALFPHGSVACFDVQTGQWSCHRYWDWDQIPDRPNVQFDEAVEETGRLLEAAVKRYSEGSLRPGVFLSGGLDSRTILGMMSPRNPPPVTANFGQKISRDVYYAEQIARTAGSRHFWFDMPDGRWVLENLDLHLALTEGFHSWVHMHGIQMLPRLRAVMDVNLTGWDGGTVMGHSDHIREIYNHPTDKWAVIDECFNRFNQSYTWPGITESSERMLYTPDFAPQVLGRAAESMATEFERYWTQYRRHYAAEFFYIDNHCMRLTQQMVTTGRSHLEFRFPFWDYQLIDFMYSLRPELRADQILYRHIITRRTPELARIPYDKKEFLPTVQQPLHTIHALTVRARRRLRLIPQRPLLYADYENYLRRELRPWAEDILFDERTKERGIFNPTYVRSLFERHLAGQEPWMLGKIAPLITFEMMMRALFD